MVTPLESSIVRFYSQAGKVIGAGFLVSKKHILTCAHVVNSALAKAAGVQEKPTVEVELDFPRVSPGIHVTAKVIFWLPVNPNQSQEDIALLELSNSIPDTVQPVQLMTSDDLWGHSFRALGFPEGQSNGVWATGKLRGEVANGWVQIEDIKEVGYRLEKGFSGTPVWDDDLDGVVGIAVAAENYRPQVKAAFIIPTNQLVKALEQALPSLGKQTIPPCPYQGLFAFREEDVKFFFGREDFTKKLVREIRKKCLIAVVGRSGSGKSSVVFAGLIPQLRQEKSLLVVSFRPENRPLYNLAKALMPLYEPRWQQLSRSDQQKEIKKLNNQFQEDTDIKTLWYVIVAEGETIQPEMLGM
ncbi:peptidase S1 and S6 chymotrypsin/Hap (plasmid) [Calothrix parasitica NIES-267]|uniref:Peptidase S1 and S6 chymotrypsin/Hap n=1 Tax=Calothrix parasitica NIES-267 TaxID=1973488 RepID=A0A1Z4M2H8_9CYAN|nr:peptidase S1 and S6 chymotrypsin/Hap [Calothrix parasitica NIES-267]